MKAVIQKVSSAETIVDGELVSSIKKGVVIFLGIAIDDDESERFHKSLNLPDEYIFLHEGIHPKIDRSHITPIGQVGAILYRPLMH